MSIDALEFTRAADLMAHYAALKIRMSQKPIKLVEVDNLKPAKQWTAFDSILTLCSPDDKVFYSMADIMGAVSAFSGISLDDLRKSHQRGRKMSRARHLVYYLARKYTLNSFPRIAAMCGEVDHSSVIYGARKIEEAFKLKGNTFQIISKIEEALRGDGK